MPEINDIVQLSIAPASTGVAREGFGVCLIVTHEPHFVDDSREYSSVSAMTADGIPSYSVAYKKALAAFSQNPRPPKVIVAPKPVHANPPTWAVKVTTGDEGKKIGFQIVDTLSGAVSTISRTVPAASSVNAEATAVEALVEAVTGIASEVTTDTITITSDGGERFYVQNAVNCEIQETTLDADYDDFLSTFQLTRDDFYFVLIDSDSQANVDKVAAWAEAATRKVFVTSTNATDELTGVGTLGYDLKDASYRKTAIVWAPEPSDEAAAGLVGMIAPRDPGSYTAAFKEIRGVSTKALTSTWRTNLTADGINHYESLKSKSFLFPGVMVSGERIDVVTGTDALEARMQEAILNLLIGTDKVPMNEFGRDMIRGTLLGVLKSFEGKGARTGLLLEGSSSVDVPAPSTLSADDRANGFWRGLTFAALYESAVTSMGIAGSVAY